MIYFLNLCVYSYHLQRIEYANRSFENHNLIYLPRAHVMMMRRPQPAVAIGNFRGGAKACTVMFVFKSHAPMTVYIDLEPQTTSLKWMSGDFQAFPV